MRNYLLLTPGPLSTSETVKEAMLQDWCTWDKDYNGGIVTPIRKGLRAAFFRIANFRHRCGLSGDSARLWDFIRRWSWHLSICFGKSVSQSCNRLFDSVFFFIWFVWNKSNPDRFKRSLLAVVWDCRSWESYRYGFIVCRCLLFKGS